MHFVQFANEDCRFGSFEKPDDSLKNISLAADDADQPEDAKIRAIGVRSEIWNVGDFRGRGNAPTRRSASQYRLRQWAGNRGRTMPNSQLGSKEKPT